jgi:hypothetical protein
VDLSGQYVDGARSQRCTKRDQSTGDQRRRRDATSRVAPWEDDDRRHHRPLITRVGTVRGMCTVYTETTLTARQAGTGGAEHGGLAINRESRTTGCSGTLVTRRESIICSVAWNTLSLLCDQLFGTRASPSTIAEPGLVTTLCICLCFHVSSSSLAVALWTLTRTRVSSAPSARTIIKKRKNNSASFSNEWGNRDANNGYLLDRASASTYLIFLTPRR